jgi:NhaP-type Na+/H+ or K+/H+ antiporter
MMIMAPLVSYLIAESLSISGLLSLMTCAYTLSIYASKNLPNDRTFLINNCFKAFSYFSRSICDLMLGLGFGIFLTKIISIKVSTIIFLIFITFTFDFLGTWLMSKVFMKRKLID